MSRYNQSRYNLAKYNRSADSAVVLDKLNIGAFFQAFVGLGQRTIDVLEAASAFSGEMKAAAGSVEQDQFDTVITPDVTGRYIVYGHDSFAAVLEGDLEPAAIVRDKLTCSSLFDSEAQLSPKVMDDLYLDAEVDEEAYLGNKMIDPAGISASAIFGASLSAESLEEIVLVLSCEIPPNGTLVIDSDNFRVLLNDENAIKYHSGDWIDSLNRKSKIVKIESGGAVEATIYFQELWL